MLIDSHGFPMRDDLKEHKQITRIFYDGIFYLEGGQLKKKGKEVVYDGRKRVPAPDPQGAKRTKPAQR